MFVVKDANGNYVPIYREEMERAMGTGFLYGVSTSEFIKIIQAARSLDIPVPKYIDKVITLTKEELEAL